MTVGQLIRILQHQDPNMIVVIPNELGYSEVKSAYSTIIDGGESLPNSVCLVID